LNELIQVLSHLTVWLITAFFYAFTVYAYLKKKKGKKWDILKGFGLGAAFATALSDVFFFSGLTLPLIVVIITTISLLIIEVT